MQTLTRIASAGSAATAIAFGPARIGFGLFLPQFREPFGIGTGTAGLISSLGFTAFLIGLVCSHLLIDRAGPRASILCGMVAAATGLGVVALAPNAIILAAGVFLAGASAGFSWTPFNAAAHGALRPADRAGALSVISTGTAAGVFLTAVLALSLACMGFGWRGAWIIFAVAAACAALANLLALFDTAEPAGRTPRATWAELATRPAIPLYVVAFSFGLTSGVYLTFAADRVAGQGGLAGLPAAASGGVVFSAYGAFGLLGLMTARIEAAVGLPWLLRALNIGAGLALALIAWAPTAWGWVIVSAGLQGVFVMMTSAVLSLWSERLFPDLPSLSFTAALVITAAGSIVGPAAAGAASSAFGPAAMLLGASGIALATAAGMMPGTIRESAGPAPALQGG